MSLKRIVLPLVAGLVLCSCAALQKTAKSSSTSVTTASTDTTKKSASKIKPYKEVITAKAITDSGLFIVHKVEDKYYFEISDSLFDRDILIVSRLAKASSEFRVPREAIGYAGDQIGENVIQFTKGPNNKVFLKQMGYHDFSSDSSENGMYRSIRNSTLQPIVAAFDIKAFSADSLGLVLDWTDYIGGDNNILFFSEKTKWGIGALQADKSYIKHIHSFPLNVEIRTVKTFSYSSATITHELNSSIVLLPKLPMKTRSYDDRVGYFNLLYRDFDVNPQGVELSSMINRWRLEPREEERERYVRGELVEPQKPIVYYIDPTTPKKWVPYLMQGVNDWQKAFEKAGFKNAIYALEAPVNDPQWSLEDARHNAIVYKPSDIPNASGPNVSDPRSGEILETHINWYHSVMEILHGWYMIQAGPNDPRAQKMEFDDSLMGQLIRFVSSHEVGHTLGLQHNFGSSSTVPVDSLRSKRWVEANGHTPSIMDYARFNYVAQPEDGISEKGIYPRIGVYDEWAIEWGYKWLPHLKTEKEEKAYMNQWIQQRVGSDKRLWFGTQMYFGVDPRCQSEDLGDDAMKASAYGILNLKRIMGQLPKWTYNSDNDYTNTRNMYNLVVNQYKNYIRQVMLNLGGLLWNSKRMGEPGAALDFTPLEKQRAAVNFLQEQLFTTPSWLFDRELFSFTGGKGFFQITNIQSSALSYLMNPSTFAKLLYFQSTHPAKAYTITQLLNDLKGDIWRELNKHTAIDFYRRGLQKAYVEQLIASFSGLAKPSDMGNVSDLVLVDMLSIVKGHMRLLLHDINKALATYKEVDTKLHLEDVRDRLKAAMELKLGKEATLTTKGKEEAIFSLDQLLKDAPCWKEEEEFDY